MRQLPRAFVVRCVAAWLLCLTASPVTAPFTTCDLSDFSQHHSSDAPRPGHQVAVPGKHRPAANVLALAVGPITTLFAIVGASPSPRFTSPPPNSIRLQTVLRI